MQHSLFITLLSLISLSVSGQDLTIKPFGDFIVVPDTNKQLHAISGIEYIPTSGQWHLASDLGDYFIFDNISQPSDLIRQSSSTRARKTTFRFEAIRYDTVSKTYYFAVETDNITYVTSYGPFPPTSLTPDFYLATVPSYDNSGIEAIALTKDFLWVAPERGWDFKEYDATGRMNFYRYGRNQEGRFSTTAGPEQFVYEVDAAARNKCRTDKSHERLGVSELIAVDENRLLVLERCYPYQNKTYIRLSAVAVNESSGQRLLKRLKINQQDAYEFSTDQIDNFEGMTWWTDPKTGKRLLVVISDDNANAKQRTLLRLLEVN
jgi:hypothetical protein